LNSFVTIFVYSGSLLFFHQHHKLKRRVEQERKRF